MGSMLSTDGQPCAVIVVQSGRCSSRALLVCRVRRARFVVWRPGSASCRRGAAESESSFEHGFSSASSCASINERRRLRHNTRPVGLPVRRPQSFELIIALWIEKAPLAHDDLGLFGGATEPGPALVGRRRYDGHGRRSFFLEDARDAHDRVVIVHKRDAQAELPPRTHVGCFGLGFGVSRLRLIQGLCPEVLGLGDPAGGDIELETWKGARSGLSQR